MLSGLSFCLTLCFADQNQIKSTDEELDLFTKLYKDWKGVDDCHTKEPALYAKVSCFDRYDYGIIVWIL